MVLAGALVDIKLGRNWRWKLEEEKEQEYYQVVSPSKSKRQETSLRLKVISVLVSFSSFDPIFVFDMNKTKSLIDTIAFYNDYRRKMA